VQHHKLICVHIGSGSQCAGGGGYSSSGAVGGEAGGGGEVALGVQQVENSAERHLPCSH
jgi:hypothetical protein